MFQLKVDVHASGSPPAGCAVLVPIVVHPPLPPMLHVTVAVPSPVRPSTRSWTLPVRVVVVGDTCVMVGLLEAASHTVVVVPAATLAVPAGMLGTTSYVYAMPG